VYVFACVLDRTHTTARHGIYLVSVATTYEIINHTFAILDVSFGFYHNDVFTSTSLLVGETMSLK